MWVRRKQSSSCAVGVSAAAPGRCGVPGRGRAAALAALRRQEPLPPSGGRRGGGTYCSGAHSRRLPGADRNRGTKQNESKKTHPAPWLILSRLSSPREIPAPKSECLYSGAEAAGFPRRGFAGRCGAPIGPGPGCPAALRRRDPARVRDERATPPPWVRPGNLRK